MSPANSIKFLTTGGDDPFLPVLLDAINHAKQIDIAVAFIRKTGLNLIFDALVDAIQSNNALPEPTRIRIITTDYLCVTDPESLRLLMVLKEHGAEVKIFATKNQSFHLKAYMFIKSQEGETLVGDAFIGSSNISKAALTNGLEWNYRVHVSPDADDAQIERLTEIRSQFQTLFNHVKTIPLEHEWISSYEQRFSIAAKAALPESTEIELPPEPTPIQIEALEALENTRALRYRRGLAVLATGLGKTWLAAFDAKQINAKRILFVAHREEILIQAEKTFLRIMPNSRTGFYTGSVKDEKADVLCASVQTLGQDAHLERFPSNHFDYIIIDEFHHAAAKTYRNVLSHFQPRFLLGLTATPERTDQADILSLCDDNLVYTCNLFTGVTEDQLAPFHYFGIFDEEVDYKEIPWRNSQFDPSLLSNKLATLSRAKHVLKQWQKKAQKRTMAFCVSIKHAEFMAQNFQQWGIAAAAIYGGSEVKRTEGLALLDKGQLDIIFCVDLFNEGVDLPSLDTVMMLRPTESKVMFLQQLGRGLRKHEEKSHLVVMDFIGNHKGFFNKPQSLFGVGSSHKAIADFAREVETGKLDIPDGCFVNYDLRLIEFMKQLNPNDLANEYDLLKATLNRRPTLTESFLAGFNITKLQKQYGSWWQFINAMQDLSEAEQISLNEQTEFFQEVEITRMTKSFKMVLLESLLSHSGFNKPPHLKELAQQAFNVFSRRRNLIPDIREGLRDLESVDSTQWFNYWNDNPVNAWLGKNKASGKIWFKKEDDKFVFINSDNISEQTTFETMLQELVDYRIRRYEPKLETATETKSNVIPITSSDGVSIPYFPNIKIACGHFKTGTADAEEYLPIGPEYGVLDPTKHFIAQASGNSMNGGKTPIVDGDYLLLEWITPTNAGSITGTAMAVERVNEEGDSQYLLRVIKKDGSGKYWLHANNPEYAEIEATEDLNSFARLKGKIESLDIAKGKAFMREDIPQLFGEIYSTGNWRSGHVALNEKRAHILLVTLNKQGRLDNQKYHDYFVDENTFHWQSQDSVTPAMKKGRELINHEKLSIEVHLFVRESRLTPNKKGASFTYYGKVKYLKHTGSQPISFEWQLT